ATQKKEPASACPAMASARVNRPLTSTGRRPTRSDSQPAAAEVKPQVTEVSDTRLATSARLTSRSDAMSSRKGARVVPLELAAKEPRLAAASSAQGKVAEVFMLSRPLCPSARDRGGAAGRWRRRAGRRRN